MNFHALQVMGLGVDPLNLDPEDLPLHPKYYVPIGQVPNAHLPSSNLTPTDTTTTAAKPAPSSNTALWVLGLGAVGIIGYVLLNRRHA